MGKHSHSNREHKGICDGLDMLVEELEELPEQVMVMNSKYIIFITSKGLEELKAEFEHLWLNAYNRRCAYDDLPNHKTYQEWYKKWGDKCEDSNFCEEAAEHYGYEGDLYDE